MDSLEIPQLLNTETTIEHAFETEDTRSTTDIEPLNLAYEALEKATNSIGNNWEPFICHSISVYEPDKMNIQVLLYNEDSDIYLGYTLYVASYDYNTLFGSKFVYSKKSWGAIQKPTPVTVHIGKVN